MTDAQSPKDIALLFLPINGPDWPCSPDDYGWRLYGEQEINGIQYQAWWRPMTDVIRDFQPIEQLNEFQPRPEPSEPFKKA